MNRRSLIVMWGILLVLVSGGFRSGSDQESLNQESVLALAWVQNAAEVRALYYQAFNLARMCYDRDLERPIDCKKRAVVVDIDETVLDNSPYNAGLIGTAHDYTDESWNRWCEAARAEPLPGAVEFLTYVSENCGEVFYVSNRKAVPQDGNDLREATLRNLNRYGFPCADAAHLLLRTRETGASKASRRAAVLEKHRVVLYMGDNLNDFSDLFETVDPGRRHRAVDLERHKFGTRFILLPNPVYGAWESSLYGGRLGTLSPAEKSRVRRHSLRTFGVE